MERALIMPSNKILLSRYFRRCESTVRDLSPGRDVLILPAEATVNCRGQLHRVRINGRGQMILEHHDQAGMPLRTAFDILDRMQDGFWWGLPECYQALWAWRACARRNVTTLSSDPLCRLVPQELRASLCLRAYSHELRGITHPPSTGDSKPPEYCRPHGLDLLCSHLLHDQCGVPRDVTCFIGSTGLVSSFTLKRGPEVLFRSVIEPDWFETIYRAGFAVVDRALTLSHWDVCPNPRKGRFAAVLCRWRLSPIPGVKESHAETEYVYLQRPQGSEDYIIVP
jgi:hypothetical protein